MVARTLLDDVLEISGFFLTESFGMCNCAFALARSRLGNHHYLFRTIWLEALALLWRTSALQDAFGRVFLAQCPWHSVVGWTVSSAVQVLLAVSVGSTRSLGLRRSDGNLRRLLWVLLWDAALGGWPLCLANHAFLRLFGNHAVWPFETLIYWLFGLWFFVLILYSDFVCAVDVLNWLFLSRNHHLLVLADGSNSSPHVRVVLTPWNVVASWLDGFVQNYLWYRLWLLWLYRFHWFLLWGRTHQWLVHVVNFAGVETCRVVVIAGRLALFLLLESVLSSPDITRILFCLSFKLFLTF